MNRNDTDGPSIRRYLLGYASGEEREQLEERFITDSEYRDDVLVIENELIEDYLADALSEEDKKSFVTYFLSTPQQLQKLKIAKALNQYFSIEAAAHSPPLPLNSSQPSGAKPVRASLLNRHPRAAAALAVAAALFVIFGSAWFLIDRWRGGDPGAQEEARNREFQLELERINGSKGGGSGPLSSPEKSGALILALPPIAFRGGGDSHRIVLPTRADMVHLLLVLPPAAEYSTYQVVLQKSGEARRFTVNNLMPETTESGRAVTLKIPVKYLSRGDYILELNGSNSEGSPEPAGSYNFRVTG